MKLLRPLTLQWWQVGIFKVALLALGIAAGAYWHEFFGLYVVPLVVIGLIACAYIIYVRWSQ